MRPRPSTVSPSAANISVFSRTSLSITPTMNWTRSRSAGMVIEDGKISAPASLGEKATVMLSLRSVSPPGMRGRRRSVATVAEGPAPSEASPGEKLNSRSGMYLRYLPVKLRRWLAATLTVALSP
ncbi:MAG: hypothetical protein BWX73_01713 [Lentisphaerae bacterium ADurb.Bin082]|nr:MAG: hypothetical protein BWX73_01713 [Lentisphaerae bacterium ADurb.Bin082]